MEEQELIDEGYIEGKKSFEYYYEEIFNNMDFEIIHKAMVATNWHWYLGVDQFGNDNNGIPTINTIKNHAHWLLKEAYEREMQLSTGGFEASWDNGELSLSFVLDSWSLS